MRQVQRINGYGLIEELLGIAGELPDGFRPPLFLTNDRMTETIAAHAEALTGHYRISWLTSRSAVVALLSKSHLEDRCRITGLNYPRTVLIDEAALKAGTTFPALLFPVILKPVKPLASFKTLVVNTPGDMAAALGRVRTSLPVIAQEYIAGDDTHIRFGAVYFDDGEPRTRFEGRKLRSRPMGHTTVAVSAPDDEVHELTLRFFAGLRLSGPASLELKQDPSGRHWVIEPTVGRTDFWVDLCVANGVNLPAIEYSAVQDLPLPIARQIDRVMWINGERDPLALAWVLGNHPIQLRARRPRGVYAAADDPWPFLAAMSRSLATLPGRGWRRIRRLAAARPPAP